MRLQSLTAILSLAALSVPATAQDFVMVQPSSDWALSMADGYCVIARNFGEGDQTVQLDLRSYEPEGRFYVLVSGDLASPSPTADRIRFVMGAAESFDVTFVAGMIAERKTIMLKPLFSLGPLPPETRERMEARQPVSAYADPEFEANIRELRFLDGLDQEFGLATGTLGPVMQALRQCTQLLTDDWGITFEQHMQLSRVALPSAQFRWIGSRRFQRQLAEGAFWTMRFIVDEEGRVAQCNITGAKSEEAAAEACEIAQSRARFEPALDAEGNPARDYWLLTSQP